MDDHVWTMAELRAVDPDLAKRVTRQRASEDADRIRQAASEASTMTALQRLAPPPAADPLAAVADLPDGDPTWR